MVGKIWWETKKEKRKAHFWEITSFLKKCFFGNIIELLHCMKHCSHWTPETPFCSNCLDLGVKMKVFHIVGYCNRHPNSNFYKPLIGQHFHVASIQSDTFFMEYNPRFLVWQYLVCHNWGEWISIIIYASITYENTGMYSQICVDSYLPHGQYPELTMFDINCMMIMFSETSWSVTTTFASTGLRLTLKMLPVLMKHWVTNSTKIPQKCCLW